MHAVGVKPKEKLLLNVEFWKRSENEMIFFFYPFSDTNISFRISVLLKVIEINNFGTLMTKHERR